MSEEPKNVFEKEKSYAMVRELLLGHGLVTSTGALWQRQRKLMAPFFTPQKLEQYLKAIAEEAAVTCARWEQIAQSGSYVDLSDEMLDLAARVVTRALFGECRPSNTAMLRSDVEAITRFIGMRHLAPIKLPLSIKIGKNRLYWNAIGRIRDYLHGTIDSRRRSLEEDSPANLLASLMLARDPETNAQMSDSQIFDEVLTLFFAGHETTARTLSFFFYSLATNHHVEEVLHHEVDSINFDGMTTLDEVGKCHYTRCVFLETLRLSPALPLYVRDVVEASCLSGAVIPKGSTIMLSPYLTHRHPSFWDNPLTFEPRRWSDRAMLDHSYSFHPFTGGQRTCIGNHFALLETQVGYSWLAMPAL